MKIKFIRDFSHNGNPIKKGKEMETHTRFTQKDITEGVAEAFIKKGVAVEVVDAKSADNRQPKK